MSIKGYIKMKYEQWLMRLLDWVCKRLVSIGDEWYIEYQCREKIYKLEDALIDCERRCNQLEEDLINADTRSINLE